jgi:hypothetical protein
MYPFIISQNTSFAGKNGVFIEYLFNMAGKIKIFAGSFKPAQLF